LQDLPQFNILSFINVVKIIIDPAPELPQGQRPAGAIASGGCNRQPPQAIPPSLEPQPVWQIARAREPFERRVVTGHRSFVVSWLVAVVKDHSPTLISAEMGILTLPARVSRSGVAATRGTLVCRMPSGKFGADVVINSATDRYRLMCMNKGR
jgi:hypothetical protein